MTPPLLLLAGFMRHYAWELFPAGLAYDAWQALGGFVMLGLVAAVVRAHWSPLTGAVAAWWALEEVQVIGCSIAQMFSPWVVAPGQEQCSVAVGVKIGAFGLVCVALLAAVILTPVKNDSTGNAKEPRQ